MQTSTYCIRFFITFCAFSEDHNFLRKLRSTLTVTPIWELDGAPITVNLPSDSDFSGNMDNEDQITADANIETLMVTEFFGIDASQVASFRVQYNGRTYSYSRTTAPDYATISFADVFGTIGFNASASTELTFIFTSNV